MLTGGPGTGKTTTINAMIHFLRAKAEYLSGGTDRTCGKENDGGDWLRGADITQTAGGQWQSRGEQTGGFGRNEENPLEADVIIIDEMSMVDLSLFHALLKAVMVGTHLDPCGGRQSASVSGTGKCVEGYDQIRMFSGCAAQ